MTDFRVSLARSIFSSLDEVGDGDLNAIKDAVVDGIDQWFEQHPAEMEHLHVESAHLKQNLKNTADVESLVAEALGFSRLHQTKVEMFADGCSFKISPDSRADLLMRDYKRVANGYTLWSQVGPHPPEELTVHEKECDHQIMLAINFANITPPIELKNESEWKNYAPRWAPRRYAERWARVMQHKMSNGFSLDEVIVEAALEAGIDTDDSAAGGVVYDAAVLLRKCWKYTDALCAWADPWDPDGRLVYRDMFRSDQY